MPSSAEITDQTLTSAIGKPAAGGGPGFHHRPTLQALYMRFSSIWENTCTT